jgi:hypothetical protein
VLKLFILILCDCPSKNLVGPEYYNQKKKKKNHQTFSVAYMHQNIYAGKISSTES